MGRTWKQFMADECGYKVKTTFCDDFTLAERHGVNAVKETYQRAFNEWKGNVEYITELVIVLNHKIWQHYEENIELGEVYNELWVECDTWCGDNLQGKDAEYYFRTTDLPMEQEVKDLFDEIQSEYLESSRGFIAYL